MHYILAFGGRAPAEPAVELTAKGREWRKEEGREWRKEEGGEGVRKEARGGSGTGRGWDGMGKVGAFMDLNMSMFEHASGEPDELSK